MLVKQGPLRADIDVHIRYTLDPQGSATTVTRVLDLTIEMPGLMKLAQPFVLRAFRKENERIMAELKRHVETPLGQRG
jgi:hypothetical protein